MSHPAAAAGPVPLDLFVAAERTYQAHLPNLSAFHGWYAVVTSDQLIGVHATLPAAAAAGVRANAPGLVVVVRRMGGPSAAPAPAADPWPA